MAKVEMKLKVGVDPDLTMDRVRGMAEAALKGDEKAFLKLLKVTPVKEAPLSDEVVLAPAYDWRISARKAAGEFGRDVLVIGAGALGTWLTTPGNTEAITHSWGPYAFLGAMVLMAGGRYLLNWRKNRDR